MSNYLTYDERLEIQKGLKNQLSFGKIAEVIGKDRTTVAKEIKKYSYEQKTGYSSYPYNACIYRKTCTKKNICPLECSSPSRYKCSICKLCNNICDDFREEVCSQRNKPHMCAMVVNSWANALSKNISTMPRMHIFSVNQGYRRVVPVFSATSLI